MEYGRRVGTWKCLSTRFCDDHVTLRVTRLHLVTRPRSFLLLHLFDSCKMSLRRFAQANAANTPGTPHSPSPRLSGGTQTPVTPRTRVSYLDSPSSTPSISSSVPFDWEAVRSRRPPPYATPLSAKRKARLSGANAAASPRKAIVRKKGFFERSEPVISTRILDR